MSPFTTRLLKILPTEDAQRPIAVQVEIMGGVVTQPMTLDEFARSMNSFLAATEFLVDIEMRRRSDHAD